MYFNLPDVWSMRYDGAIAFRLNAEDVKVRLYLCQVKVDDSICRDLMISMDGRGNPVRYPTVRSEIHTYNIANDNRHYEIDNKTVTRPCSTTCIKQP